MSIAVIVVSAPAMPWGFVAVWTVALVAWAIAGAIGRQMWLTRAAAVVATLAAGGLELSYERLVPLSAGHLSTLCVLGDSITAGLGRPGETPWPTLLRASYGVPIVDLSRAGCTLVQAVQRAAWVPPQALVLIEVGGNDTIGRVRPAQFAAELDALARAVDGSGRAVVMFELPRFPFDDRYGLQQRRVASQHHIRLIPRRWFTAVLASAGATTDGIHLSNAGQQQLADLVWRAVGPALGRGSISGMAGMRSDISLRSAF